MGDILVFLASSIEEFEVDRAKIGSFFNSLNRHYTERGLFISLIMCEDMDNAIALSRKQEEYNAEIRDSDLVFFLFLTKAGQYTLEEFEVAYKSFRDTNKPKIITYFKEVKRRLSNR